MYNKFITVKTSRFYYIIIIYDEIIIYYNMMVIGSASCVSGYLYHNKYLGIVQSYVYIIPFSQKNIRHHYFFLPNKIYYMKIIN